MRISTSMMFNQGVARMGDMQAELVRTQAQLASGKRVLTPADDPVAAARLLTIRDAIEQNSQYQRNANLARNRLALEEQTLQDVQNVLMRIRDLAVQANNDTQNSETRSFIAAEVREALAHLVELGNTRDAGGNYLFAGFSALSQPFTISGTDVTYHGDQGQRSIAISDTRRVADSDPGDAVFLDIKNGNGEFYVAASDTNTGTAVVGARSLTQPALWNDADYTVRFTAADSYDVLDSGGTIVASASYADGDSIDVSGVSLVVTGVPAAGDELFVGPSRRQGLFSTVQQFVDALAAPTDPAGIAHLHNEVGNALLDLDQGIGNILDFRTRVGTRLQALQSQEQANTDYAVTLETARTELESVDYAEAVTRLNQQLVGLEAAQQSFVRIQGLSLFNLIR